MRGFFATTEVGEACNTFVVGTKWLAGKPIQKPESIRAAHGFADGEVLGMMIS
jgi:hypothetical protein